MGDLTGLRERDYVDLIGCLHDRANMEQTSSKHIELAQAGLLYPRPLAQM